MKKSLGVVFTIMALVISSLLFLTPSTKVMAGDDLSNVIDSEYIFDSAIDSAPYKSADIAGTTAGYGKFMLGREDVELTTHANVGFTLVGWTIISENGDKTFVDAESLDENNSKQVTFSSSTITLTYLDTNSDGYLDCGKFLISQIAEDMTVNAVFNYIYYNLDITDVILATDAINKAGKYTILDLPNGLDKVYYTESVDNKYINAIVFKGSEQKYYYYNEVYFDGTSLFTLHERRIDIPSDMEIDYTRGAYRLKDVVELSIDVNITDDIETSKNIDIKGYNFSIDGVIDNTHVSNFIVSKDEYTRSNSVLIRVEINDSVDKTNQYLLDYDNLYTANILPFTDSQILEGEQKVKLLDKMQINNAYFAISKERGYYFVKDARQNAGIGFRVSVPQKITENIDGMTYEYYRLDTLNGQNNYTYSYGDSEINSHIDVIVNYVSINYTVNFEFRLFDRNNNTLSQIDGDFHLEDELSLLRGDTYTINKTEKSNNTGYNFYGFAFNNYSFSENNSIIVNIDSSKPKNQLIYMIFERIDYTFAIKNIDSISLNNAGETIYPLDRVEIEFDKGGSKSDKVISSNELRVSAGNYVLDEKLNINDKLIVRLLLNNGFKINGYRFLETEQENEYINNIEMNIDEAFLNKYVDGSDINLFINEDFIRYVFTYYILASAETPNNDSKIMADLSVEYNGVSYSINDTTLPFNIQIEKTDIRNAIIMTELKLYDKVLLKADGVLDSFVNNDSGETIEFNYVFNRITENNKTNFTPDTYDGAHVEYTTTILKDDTSIRVVYSRPDARLIISMNNERAYDISQIQIYEDNQVLELDTIEGVVDIKITASSNIRVVLNPNGEVASRVFNFGYRLDSFTLESNNTTNTTPANNLLEYSFVAGSSIQRLTLNFAEISYRLRVDQYYDNDKSLGYVQFDDKDYKELTVSDKDIVFDMPVGYYVSKVYFVNNGIQSSYNIEQTNQYQSSVFEHHIDDEEFITMVRTYGSSDGVDTYLNLKVVYTLHTYTIKVNYGITNPKNSSYDNQIIFPDMTLEYVFKGGDRVRAESNYQNRVISFVNIPYGSTNVVISVADTIPKGLTVYGWTINDYNDAPSSDMYYNSSSTELSFKYAITYDVELNYKLTYASYEVHAVSDNSLHGNPIVYVNSAYNPNQPTINNITLYDELQILMNANSTYRFSRMTYFKDGVEIEYLSYDVYLYIDNDRWLNDYLTLYTYQEGVGYIRNTAKEYDESITYYTSNIRAYRDGMFNIANYDITDGSIIFNIEYVEKEIIILNRNSNYTSTTLQIADLDIAPDDYSIIDMKVTHKNGIIENVGSDNIISTQDRKVDITITMNTAVVDEEEYGLWLGVSLAQINMQSSSKSFTKLDSSTYLFTFNINDIIDFLHDSGLLIINYNYIVLDKIVTLTTNVDDPSFYENTSGYRFEMSYSNSVYGFGTTVNGSYGQPSLSNSFRFLGKSLFTYVNHHSRYFEVYDMKVYKPRLDSEGNPIIVNGDLVAGEEIPLSQYKRYGVILDKYGAVDFDIKEALKDGFDVRFIDNLVIKLQIQPIIYYHYDALEEGAYIFTSTFIYDDQGNGIGQKLNVGSSSASQIQMDDFIYNFLKENGVKYYLIDDISNTATTPTNAGRYRVEFNFGEQADYEWLKNIELTYKVYFDIIPKEIELVCNVGTNVFAKVYDGTTAFNSDNLLQYLMFTDRASLNVNYGVNCQFTLDMARIASWITYTGAEGVQVATARADDNITRNIYLSGLALRDTRFNNNFVISTDFVVILNSIKIMRKEISISSIQVYDKVFDGSTNADVVVDNKFELRGIVGHDDVRVDPSAIGAKFENAEVGINRKVLLTLANVLTGEDSENYKLKDMAGYANIYPYSISTEVDGFGTITITNERGKTERDKVDLIPIGARLDVAVIRVNSAGYVSIYPYINEFLESNIIFAVGYRLSFVNGLSSTNVSNELYLTIPNVNKLTSAVWLTGEEAGKLDYTIMDNMVKIDLSQIDLNVDSIILTQQRVLLQLWQILLIVFGAVLLIVIIVIIFIVVRKKKQLKYGRFDKI